MPVRESKAVNIGSLSGSPEGRPTLLLRFLKIYRWRRRTATVVVVLVVAIIGGCQDDSYSDHWRQALKAIDARDFPLAETQLNRCLEACPFNAEAQFLMARTCRRADDFEGWLDHLQIAAILGWPQDQIHLELRLREAQVANTWTVEQQLQNYLSSGHPEEVLIVEALVKGYLENDRPKEAYRLAEEWIKNFPDDWLARFYHGRACQYGVRFEEAIADYEKVLEIKPDQAEARLSLAKTFMSFTQFDQAMKHYRAYLENDPGNADALFGLAKCQFTLGDSQSARATLDELFSRYPNHNAGLYLRAQLEQVESPAKALPWLLRAEAVTPNQPEILDNLIVTLHALHRDKEAALYESRLKVCRQKVHDLIELKTQLVKEPDKVNLVDLRYQVAVLQLELGQEDEAAHWFQTVLYIDPDHRPTLRALAEYWEKHGDPRRAAYYRDWAEGKRPPLPSANQVSR